MQDHTFVIPAYKQSLYLETCVQSLVKQTVKSKIVITTSTPTAQLQNIAGQYGIPYIVNNNGSKGIAADWNFALHAADTQFVTIAHQDDIYSEQYAETILCNVNPNNTLIAFTDYVDMVNNSDRGISLNALVKSSLLFPFFFSRRSSSFFFKKLILLFGNPICCPSVTYNMPMLRGFCFSDKYKYTLDWYAWYQLAKRTGSFLYINKKLVKHRIHPDSETTAQLNNGSREREERELFELMWGKSMARLLSPVYRLGHKANRV